MIQQEAKLFIRAVQVLTRLPTPRLDDDPDALPRAAKYFPLVGQLVGTISGLTLLLAHRVWDGILPALLAVGVGVAVTGAFHEDGLADTADGLGGGRTREQRLAIMKDSRVGTYGLLALSFCLAIRVAALTAIGSPAIAAFALLAAHGGGRCAAVAMMALQNYAGDPSSAKLSPTAEKVRFGELTFAIAISAWPLFFLGGIQAIVAVLAGSVGAFWLARKSIRLIGGYTGDILGAIEQVFEAAFLLGASAAVIAS